METEAVQHVTECGTGVMTIKEETPAGGRQDSAILLLYREGEQAGTVKVACYEYAVLGKLSIRLPVKTGREGQPHFEVAEDAANLKLAPTADGAQPAAIRLELPREKPIIHWWVPGDAARGGMPHCKNVVLAKLAAGEFRTHEVVVQQHRRPDEKLGPPGWVEAKELLGRMLEEVRDPDGRKRDFGLFEHRIALVAGLAALALETPAIAERYAPLIENYRLILDEIERLSGDLPDTEAYANALRAFKRKEPRGW